MQKKKVFLFDMDGTLTKPREKIKIEIVENLIKIREHDDIGILT